MVLAAGILQPLVVHHEAFDDELPQMGGGPLSELRATGRAYPVADRANQVEVVELCAVLLAVGGSCQGFLDN